jgi:predicted transcriptional regulator
LVVESAEALMRLVTPENRELLRIIRDQSRNPWRLWRG